MFVDQTQCPLCHTTSCESILRFNVYYDNTSVPVVRCRVCGLDYKKKVLVSQDLIDVYNSDYTHFSKDEDQNIYQSRLSRIVKLVGRNSRHLDYGCGNGGFVTAALAQGLESVGADPFLPEYLLSPAERTTFYRLDGSSEGILALGQFDVITLWAVIEHLPQLQLTMQNLGKMLKPGGSIFFNSPFGGSIISRLNGEQWNMAAIPEHLHFQTDESIRFFSKILKLNIKQIRYCGSPYPFGSTTKVTQAPSTSSDVKIVVPLEAQKSSGIAKKLSAMVYKKILGNTGNGTVANTIRVITNALRIGDHVEVVLEKPVGFV